MTATTDSMIRSTRRRLHPHCYVCGELMPEGLGVDYRALPDGRVEAVIDCPHTWEGYPGLVHGGIIATLLDGAMTNCLFAHHIAAVTADLHVRFRHPVCLGHTMTIHAEVTRGSPPVFVVKAVLVQEGRVRATSVGKFMKRSEREIEP